MKLFYSASFSFLDKQAVAIHSEQFYAKFAVPTLFCAVKDCIYNLSTSVYLSLYQFAENVALSNSGNQITFKASTRVEVSLSALKLNFFKTTKKIKFLFFKYHF